jgi:diguanylate cyclase (GGDEF)-like protein/PAS domain S-box-containing protein
LGKGADALTTIEFAQTLIVVAYLTALPVADVISGQELLRSALSEEVLQREQLTQDLLARKQRIKQQNQILEVERNRLRDAIDILPEGIVMLDAENRYITWNKKYEEMYPQTAYLMPRGQTFEEVTRAGLQLGMYSEAIGREEAWLKDRLESLKNPGVAREQVLADGRHLLIEERRTSEGGLVGLRIDITDMKRREASTRLLFENNPVPMLVTSEATHEILAANQAAVVQYGYKKADFENVRWCELLGLEPQAASEFLGLDSGHVGVEGRIVKMFKRDGSAFEAEIYASSFQLDNVQSSLVAVIDVTKRRNAEKHAAYMALHDALTGLPNRNLLAERMPLAMARARRGDKVALLFLDLDHFKSVNDTFGHSVGDELLKCVSDRLKRCVRETDTVARLGGDEFAILLTGASIPEGAARVATRIVNSIRMPYRIAGQEINCGVSVGIAIAPDDTTNTAELFRFADLALYSVKEDRRGSYRFFQIDMDSRVRHRIAIENELRQAILNNELELDYQPIVSQTGKTTCVEALVRWQHPERGRVAPGAFIPLAEETGLILDIGKFVLFQACLEAANWPDDVAVSVNLSALEIENPDLVKTIREALDTSGLAPHRLQVEITETVLMKDVDRAVQTLAELADVGIQLAMDDFGVGYSSLSMLRKFPFKKLKIDRAFVRDLETSQEARSILATIVKLAGTLNMKATAEGIETVEQHDIADRCGCSEFQGYLFCRPISAADVARRLQFQAQDEHHAA